MLETYESRFPPSSRLSKVITKNLRMRGSLDNLFGLLKVLTKVVTECLEMTEDTLFVILSFYQRFCLAEYMKNMGSAYIYKGVFNYCQTSVLSLSRG